MLYIYYQVEYYTMAQGLLDGRRVGWGWYQTQRTVNGAQVGDETLRPGVHLNWTQQPGDGELLDDLAKVVED